MSLFVVKYLPQYGFVGAKNFEFTFKPNLILRKSFRWSTERLYVWDNISKYSEGINEHGICVFSSNITSALDSTEGRREATPEQKAKAKAKKYHSPDGLRIRKALSESSVQKTINKLIELQIVGCTVVFDTNMCILMESGFIKDEQSSSEKFVYETRIMNPTDSIVRVNHGILLPWLGYSSSVPEEKELRRESEHKQKLIEEALFRAQTPIELLDSISSKELLSKGQYSKSRTAFQILLKPSEKTLHARACWCSLAANLNRLNSMTGKTSFEISSPKKMSFMEHLSFKQKLI